MSAVTSSLRSVWSAVLLLARGVYVRSNTVEAYASPGLVTLLDVALYRSNGSFLTSSVCAANALLAAFLELKRRSSELLGLVLRGRHRIGDVEKGVVGGSGGGSRRRGVGGGGGGGSGGAGLGVGACAVGWFDIGEEAEAFARLCLDCADQAIQRIVTDKLAATANLNPDPESGEDGSDSGGVGTGGSSSGGGGSSSLSKGRSSSSASLGDKADDAVAEGVLLESSDGSWGGGEDGGGGGGASAGAGAGRKCRRPRRRDCWESPRLFCPDHVWADEVLSCCQKVVRTMAKHRFLLGGCDSGLSILGEDTTGERSGVVGSGGGGGGDGRKSGGGGGTGGSWSDLSPVCVHASETLRGLIWEDLPGKLHQFRSAAESDTSASKRLHLIKCEYRAPFRGFLEAHVAVQKAPRIELVDVYLALHKRGDSDELRRRKEGAERRIKTALENPSLVEALKLEQRCEAVEVAMARAVMPFSELARCLERRGKACVAEVTGLLEGRDVDDMNDMLRRLRTVLCRKGGSESSTGIRALLLDVQGVPRRKDDTLVLSQKLPFGSHRRVSKYEATLLRLRRMLSLLQCLNAMCRAKGGFQSERFDIPSSVLKGCALLDAEMFEAQYKDWHDMVTRQRELSSGDDGMLFAELSEEIRKAEIEVSIALAAQPALELVRQRLDMLEKDRMKRFGVLQELVREACVREMGMNLVLTPPEKDVVLELPEISALGVFGLQLQMVGEPLPLG